MSIPGLDSTTDAVDNLIELDHLDNPKVAARAREVVLAIPGVVSAEPSPAIGQLVMRYNPSKTNLSMIVRTLMAAGLTSSESQLEHYDYLRNYVSQNPKAHALPKKGL